MRVRRYGWKAGPEPAEGEVVVSATDLRVDRFRDLLGVYANGTRLRLAWPLLHGAVGLWVWSEPGARRSGSISVWRSDDDLRRFVGTPIHVAIMRAYRDRGTLLASTWRTTFRDADAIWADGRRRVMAARAEATA
jgi:hypothetical protein